MSHGESCYEQYEPWGYNQEKHKGEYIKRSLDKQVDRHNNKRKYYTGDHVGSPGEALRCVRQLTTNTCLDTFEVCRMIRIAGE